MVHDAKLETAVVGGGCFWCLDALYRQVRGVHHVVSGFAGGTTPNLTYWGVVAGGTGHAEVVQIHFDPTVISYQKILEIFYSVHDPTTLNRQNYDVGEDYRSIILYRGIAQKRIAEDVTKGYAQEHWEKPIVTEVKPLDQFYPAEETHQNFFGKNPQQAYCQIVINPKLDKFRREFASLLTP